MTDTTGFLERQLRTSRRMTPGTIDGRSELAMPVSARQRNGGPLVSAGGARRTATVFVAAADSSEANIAGADYPCDGDHDEVQIAAAIDFVSAAGGGTVFLCGGVYFIEDTIAPTDADWSNVHLTGEGPGTVISFGSGYFADHQATIELGRRRNTISDLTIYGEVALKRIDTTPVEDLTVRNCIFDCLEWGLQLEWDSGTAFGIDLRDNEFLLDQCVTMTSLAGGLDRVRITGNFHDGSNDAIIIDCGGGAGDVLVRGNDFLGGEFYFTNVSNLLVIDNVFVFAQAYFNDCTGGMFCGNTMRWGWLNLGQWGGVSTPATHMLISGNMIDDSVGVNFESDYNSIAANTFWDIQMPRAVYGEGADFVGVLANQMDYTDDEFNSAFVELVDSTADPGTSCDDWGILGNLMRAENTDPDGDGFGPFGYAIEMFAADRTAIIGNKAMTPAADVGGPRFSYGVGVGAACDATFICDNDFTNAVVTAIVDDNGTGTISGSVANRG